MNIVLWVLQVLLAVAFIGAGIMKATQPVAQLGKRMEWVNAVPAWLVRFIGVAEFLGGVGLILPALTKVLPWLTPVAALGLAIIMLLAAGFHIQHKENKVVPVNIVLFLLAAIIVVGRFAIEPL